MDTSAAPAAKHVDTSPRRSVASLGERGIAIDGTSCAIATSMRRPLVFLHFAHAVVPFALFLVADSLLLRLVFGALSFVSLFAFTHDAMHRVLGLPRWLNELSLTLGAALMGMSGSAARVLHFVHHARPGAPDDVEGRALRQSLLRNVLLTPFTYFTLPFVAYRRSRPALRRRQLLEWALAAGFLGSALVLGGGLRTYALVCLLAQITVPIWAGLLPHRAPPRLLALAARFTWTRSPLVLSFVFHDEHHEHANGSVFELGLGASEPLLERGVDVGRSLRCSA